MHTKSEDAPARLCGVRFTTTTMSRLVQEAARQTVANGRSVSVAAVVRSAVADYLGRIPCIAGIASREAV
jgi:hypothetical protein